MTTTTVSTRCQAILDEVGKIPVIVPGKLGSRRDARGHVTGWKLQRWHEGRNETRHIPAALQLPAPPPPFHTSGPFVLATKFAVTVMLPVTPVSVRGSAVLASLQFVNA